jgi:multidrug resistance efflux pump
MDVRIAATSQPGAAQTSPAMRLLRHESDIRKVAGEAELLFHLVNEVRALVQYGAALVFRRQRGTGRLQVVRLSDLPDVDRDTPLLRALENRVVRLDGNPGLGTPTSFVALESDPAAVDARDVELLAAYPFVNLLWLPLKDRAGAVDAGVVFARAEPFTAGEQTLLTRLSQTYAHAWSALPVRRSFGRGVPVSRRTIGAIAAGLLLVAVFPVRLSVMAPVEVVAAAPFVVTAPIAGVVRSLLVAPSTAVAAGQPLVQFEDIQPRNEMVLAQQRLAVAQARDTRTEAAAFRDPTAAHDMAAAHAEFDLARVTYEYAVEVLQRTQVRAPHAGLAIYTDRRDWEGRAVQIGEEIMQVADPMKVALRIDLATANSIELAPGADVGIYLDNAPLGGLAGRLRSVSYTPRPQPGGGTSYTVMADPENGPVPRIGARGTARLYGRR